MRKNAGCYGFCYHYILEFFARFTSLRLSAHTKSQSFSSWQWNNNSVRAVVTVPSLQATRLLALEDPLKQHLSLEGVFQQHMHKHWQVARQRENEKIIPCPQINPPVFLSQGQSAKLRVELTFVCPQTEDTSSDTGALVIQNDSFFTVSPSHIHFARFRAHHKNAPHQQEFIFSSTKRQYIWNHHTQAPPVAPSFTDTLVSYGTLGAEHILTGFDHLVFLLVLLLLCRTPRFILFAITGFTVGHSLTLMLTVLEWVQPNHALVEILIAFTIIVAAAEAISVPHKATRKTGLYGAGLMVAMAVAHLIFLNFATAVPYVAVWLGLALFCWCYGGLLAVVRQPLRLTPVITTFFGLIHGFGFAGVILQIGLPPQKMATALASFNLGVEVGQVAICAALWLCGYGLIKVFPRGIGKLSWSACHDFLCAAMGGLGMVWLLSRAFF